MGSSTAPRLALPLSLDAAMHAAQLQRRQMQQTASESEVRSVQGERNLHTREARAAQQQSEQKAAEASDHAKSAGTWKTVAAIAGAVAGAAAIACSAGTATPLVIAVAGIALSASSPYIGAEVGKATGSEKAGTYVGLGCLVVGTAMSVLSGGGAATGTSAAVQITASSAKFTANVASGAATIGAGVQSKREKASEAGADHAAADAQTARNESKNSQGDMQTVVEGLRSLDGSIRRALETIASAEKEAEAVRTQLVNRIGRSC